MANIAITTYDIIKDASVKQVSELFSLPLPDGREPPKGLLTCLYGTRDTIASLQNGHILARKMGGNLFRTDMLIDVGESSFARHKLEDAANLIFLNTSRMNNALEEKVLQLLGLPAEKDLSDYINQDVSIINKIFDLDLFENLTAVIWPAKWKDSKKLQMAAVKDLSKIKLNKNFTARHNKDEPDEYVIDLFKIHTELNAEIHKTT
ncbi:hypothetical protein Q9L42_021135 (plasmid) [Methylomarinum sp. Ch1-1]|uniref:RES domain-containing protein n=1 Tax=Methylomarinum roseum TaxID=3067653 RepID=A0AAU7P0N3_9GAMM|nr:hypothetical protein [Methylomarinum sp. Ch1-1]MDP4523161.1 hypothetical protein [Methylomarinum sp. Ch1-1]